MSFIYTFYLFVIYTHVSTFLFLLIYVSFCFYLCVRLCIFVYYVSVYFSVNPHFFLFNSRRGIGIQLYYIVFIY